MILCLSCNHCSPAGAQWCAFCGKSLGCVYCLPHGHKGPLLAGQMFCSQCGSTELSEGSHAIDLTPVLRLVVWLGLGGLGALALDHALAPGGWLNQLLTEVAGLVTATVVVSFLLPPAMGAALRGGLCKVLGYSAQIIGRGLWGALCLTATLLEGPKAAVRALQKTEKP